MHTILELYNFLDASFIEKFEAHSNDILALKEVNSLKNKYLISGSADCTIKIWDLSKSIRIPIFLF